MGCPPCCGVPHVEIAETSDACIQDREKTTILVHNSSLIIHNSELILHLFSSQFDLLLNLWKAKHELVRECLSCARRAPVCG